MLKDSIFYYTKSENYTYFPVFTELNSRYKTFVYSHQNGAGNYRLDNITAPANKSKNEEWRGYNPATRGRSWGISKEAVINLVGEEKAKKMSNIEKLELLYENGLIIFSKNGVPSFKRYLHTSKGTMLGDVWTDITNVSSHSNEKIGYPTQKPESLLERIILCASNEGDVILDPFVGGGTTVCVADKLKRNWIGIDESEMAIKITKQRLNKMNSIFEIVE